MLKAIIVDDEIHGRETLKLALNKFCPEIEIIGIAETVKAAISLIQNLSPDIIFLDIELPDGNGFDVIEAFENPSFEVVFVTAYGSYAIKAIKVSALDYIVKPIDHFELINAVRKALSKRAIPHTTRKQLNLLKEQTRKEKLDKIVLPADDGYLFVDVKDIIRCEAESNYTRFYLVNNLKLLISKTLKEYEDLLISSHFVRIHNSHLINLNHVKKYIKGKGGFVIMSDGTEVEVSVRKKNEFLDMFHN